MWKNLVSVGQQSLQIENHQASEQQLLKGGPYIVMVCTLSETDVILCEGILSAAVRYNSIAMSGF